MGGTVTGEKEKKGKKKRKGGASGSRERILEAAVHLFARQGYGNTGMRELAAAADVNLAMINYFFGSKKGLLKEILDIFFSGYLQVARRELAGGEEAAVKLDRFIRAAVAFFADHADYLLVFISEMPRDDPEIIEHKASWGRQMIETVEENLGGEAQGPGRGHGIAPVLFCSSLTALMASRFLFTPVMEQVEPERMRSVSVDEYAAMISALFLRGVGSEERAETREKED